MSKFDTNRYVDYEKLASNIKIVRERYAVCIILLNLYSEVPSIM